MNEGSEKNVGTIVVTYEAANSVMEWCLAQVFDDMKPKRRRTLARMEEVRELQDVMAAALSQETSR